MSDKQENGANKPQQAPLVVNGQYIKDLSFESPNSPSILADMQGKQPSIDVNFNISSSPIETPNAPKGLCEVVLELRAEMKVEDKVGYLVELKYAGVFTINVPDEHLNAILMIECPRILFPFARQVLSDVTQGGGFMPLMMQPLDFAGMYQTNAKNAVAAIDEEVNGILADKEKSLN